MHTSATSSQNCTHFVLDMNKPASPPLNPAVGLGSAASSPAVSGAEPQPKSNLVHLNRKIWHLVTTILIIFLRISWPDSVRNYWLATRHSIQSVHWRTGSEGGGGGRTSIPTWIRHSCEDQEFMRVGCIYSLSFPLLLSLYRLFAQQTGQSSW